MDNLDEPIPDEAIPSTLVKRGWEQGAIFHSPITQSWATGAREDGTFGSISMDTPSTGCFVVVSQTCDIAAAIDKEPGVEAMPCSQQFEPGFRTNAKRSYRWFDIHNDDLFVHGMYRTSFQKRSLLQLEPRLWPGTDFQKKRFLRWLARRASRSAIDNSVVNAFCKPLQKILYKHDRKSTEIGELFNNVVREVRISPPTESVPPFSIGLLLITDAQDVSVEEADAINQVIEELTNTLDSSQASLEGCQLHHPSSVSLEFFDATLLVDFDALTFDGEEARGAEPLAP